ncbi:MAG: HAMP domain-containing protein [Sandaracinus sp.]|nr:HAMP domain-containing protein [Sandaracinus sp.]MCB9634368.1 HAMP domain-containing protein [Sandaracinus sp.]
MNVATKLTLALLVAITAVHLGMGAVRVGRETARFEHEAREDAAVYGRTLAALVRVAWLEGGEEQVASLLATANAADEGLQIAWRSGRVEALVRSDDSGVHVLVPVTLPDGSRGAIAIDDPQRDERAYVRESIRNVVVTVVVLALLCALAAGMLGHTLVGRPAKVLAEHARRVASGDLSEELAPRPGRDELAQLTAETNRMTRSLREARDRSEEEVRRRLEAVEQLRHVDRLRTVGTLASGIAHELGTPLNVVLGHAQLLQEAGDEGSRAGADAIVKQCRRMTAIVQQLLSFARRSGRHEGHADAAEIGRETLGMLGVLAKKRDVSLAIDAPEHVGVELSPELLRQVLSNLVVNAVHASEAGDVVRLVIARDGDEVVLSVVDEGVGMDEGTLARIFDPFFTTKDVGEGSGLGLSVTFGIVAEAGGTLDASSELGRGSTFVVRLPPAKEEA